MSNPATQSIDRLFHDQEQHTLSASRPMSIQMNLQPMFGPSDVSAWIKWAQANWSQLPDIIQAGQALMTAKGLIPRWEAFKPLGDEVVPLLASSPLFVTPTAQVSLDQLKVEASAVYGANGAIIAQFIQLLPVLVQAFQTLWPIIAPFIKPA